MIGSINMKYFYILSIIFIGVGLMLATSFGLLVFAGGGGGDSGGGDGISDGFGGFESCNNDIGYGLVSDSVSPDIGGGGDGSGGATGGVPGCAVDYLSPCTSMPNDCGETIQGTIQCDGSCRVSSPISLGDINFNTVICTELYKLDLVDEDTYKLETEFGQTKLTKVQLSGYHAWGEPVAEAMKKDNRVIEIGLKLVQNFHQEMLFRMGEKDAGSVIGEILMNEGILICQRIGELRIIDDKTVINHFTEEKVKEMLFNAEEENDIDFAHVLIRELEKETEYLESIIK